MSLEVVWQGTTLCKLLEVSMAILTVFLSMDGTVILMSATSATEALAWRSLGLRA